MIKILKRGSYRLIETRRQTKVLIFDGKNAYAWVSAPEIGEMLVWSRGRYTEETMLSAGSYRIYDVKDEPRLTDLIHLELSVGTGMWQGYLLPTGLPTSGKKRNRIIPTDETITKSVQDFFGRAL